MKECAWHWARGTLSAASAQAGDWETHNFRIWNAQAPGFRTHWELSVRLLSYSGQCFLGVWGDCGFQVRVLLGFCRQSLPTMAEECQPSWRCLRIGFTPRPATSAAEQREVSTPTPRHPCEIALDIGAVHQMPAQAVTPVGRMTWCFPTNSNKTWCDFHMEPQRQRCACHLSFELSWMDLFYSSVLV